MSVSRKTGEIYYTDDELQVALQNNNALQYALSRGYKLIRVGNEYRLKEHDSMVFQQSGKWYWNSQHKHGRALDFIQTYENKSYKEAVCILAGTINLPAPVGPALSMPHSIQEEKAEFILPEHAKDYDALFAYLTKTRCFDHDFINDLVEQRKIYPCVAYNKLKLIGYTKDGQARYAIKEKDLKDFGKVPGIREQVSTGFKGAPFITKECLSPDTIKNLLETEQIRMYQNLVMLGFDQEGVPHYASLRSMNSFGKPIKVDVSGSDKSYPFALEGSTGNNTICVFESPIETMSYWSLCKITGSDRINCPMISLGGAGTTLALDRYLREHPEIKNIVIGLNNDSKDFGHEIDAGRNGTKRIMERYGNSYHISIHQPHLNDWNDVLKNYRHNLEGKVQEPSRPINRHGKVQESRSAGIAI
ncbi:toprim domain-containing protein [Caproiciproducens galactitolivorans]|uniref:DUF3991 domain-containing protein n=1 Tax=Caproiciproducens galactitolivorans TaxID=642589 RepID=A0ABT4BPN4_9FIRM|nr:toprim domain-containing protein [Caproiciproducens galactitolivorans]MCY1712849.1 DUF3991 domain-containing protein [Caproiciproducens galactitolivorans]